MNARRIGNLFKILIFKFSNQFGGRFRQRLPQFSLENILNKNFKDNAPFSLFLIGANDGISHDFLFKFLQKREIEGIAVEPLADVYQCLEKNFSCFPNVKPLNLAVHPTLEEVVIYRVNPQSINEFPAWVNGIGSVLPDHHKKAKVGSEFIIEEKVKALPLMKICEAYNTNSFDLLQIDVEGFDYEVIKMIDFKKIKPSIIKYEYSNLSLAEHTAAWEILSSNGYFVYSEGIDAVAVDCKSIEL